MHFERKASAAWTKDRYQLWHDVRPALLLLERTPEDEVDSRVSAAKSRADKDASSELEPVQMGIDELEIRIVQLFKHHREEAFEGLRSKHLAALDRHLSQPLKLLDHQLHHLDPVVQVELRRVVAEKSPDLPLVFQGLHREAVQRAHDVGVLDAIRPSLLSVDDRRGIGEAAEDAPLNHA